MSFPRYPAYKDSGVEWLGQVPTHWTIKSIKWLSPVLRGASPRPIDDPKYFDDDGEYAWVRIADSSASSGVLTETTQRLSELGSSLSVRLEPGALFVSIAGTVGKPCITAMKACIHDGFVYFPRLRIDPKFLFRVFEAGVCYAGLGKMGTQLNLNTDTIGSIRVALPPPDELPDVLSFIDRETTKIDALVAEQEQLVTLLKEKRQAVISHAVTKGLDPSVPMKDSGVEWLGEVPTHWQVRRVKDVTRLESGHTPSKTVPEYWIDCDIPWVSLNDSKFLAANDYITDTAVQINQLGIENSSARLLPAGSVVFTRDATIGLAAITTREMAVSQHLIAWCPTGLMDPAYLLRVFNAMKDHLDSYTFGATIKTIGMGDVKSLVTPVPPHDEQAAIAAFLGKALQVLDQLVDEAVLSIELLRERRSALISAAVTGQIDVRGLAPAQERAA